MKLTVNLTLTFKLYLVVVFFVTVVGCFVFCLYKQHCHEYLCRTLFLSIGLFSQDICLEEE